MFVAHSPLVTAGRLALASLCPVFGALNWLTESTERLTASVEPEPVKPFETRDQVFF
jgi:hypothetical protein